MMKELKDLAVVHNDQVSALAIAKVSYMDVPK